MSKLVIRNHKLKVVGPFMSVMSSSQAITKDKPDDSQSSLSFTPANVDNEESQRHVNLTDIPNDPSSVTGAQSTASALHPVQNVSELKFSTADKAGSTTDLQAIESTRPRNLSCKTQLRTPAYGTMYLIRPIPPRGSRAAADSELIPPPEDANVRRRIRGSQNVRIEPLRPLESITIKTIYRRPPDRESESSGESTPSPISQYPSRNNSIHELTFPQSYRNQDSTHDERSTATSATDVQSRPSPDTEHSNANESAPLDSTPSNFDVFSCMTQRPHRDEGFTPPQSRSSFNLDSFVAMKNLTAKNDEAKYLKPPNRVKRKKDHPRFLPFKAYIKQMKQSKRAALKKKNADTFGANVDSVGPMKNLRRLRGQVPDYYEPFARRLPLKFQAASYAASFQVDPMQDPIMRALACIRKEPQTLVSRRMLNPFIKSSYNGYTGPIIQLPFRKSKEASSSTSKQDEPSSSSKSKTMTTSLAECSSTRNRPNVIRFTATYQVQNSLVIYRPIGPLRQQPALTIDESKIKIYSNMTHRFQPKKGDLTKPKE